MPFPFNSIFYLKKQRTIQVIHIKYQSKHSIHTSSKQSLSSFAGYNLNICHAWQRRPPFPVNLRDLASLRPEGMQAKYSGRCTPLEYPLLDWYGPFGSLPPSRWYGRGLDQSEAFLPFSAE